MYKVKNVKSRPAFTGRVFIMGAGASRYAGAPLVDDFLDQIKQKYSYDKEFGICQKIFDRYSTFSGNIELLLTILDLVLESRANFLKGFSINEVVTLRRTIIKFALDLLGPHNLEDICDTSRRFVKRYIQDGDVIVSFNYDLLLDDALWKNNLLNPRYAYCVGKGKINPNNKIIRKLQEHGIQSRSPVRLLKPHGSVNWVADITKPYFHSTLEVIPSIAEDIGLKAKLTEIYFNGIMPRVEDAVIAPSFVKKFRFPELFEVWYNAQLFISQATKIYIIGYQSTDSDTAAQVLLNSARGNRQIEGVYLINPKANKLQQKFSKYFRCDVTPIEVYFESWVNKKPVPSSNT